MTENLPAKRETAQQSVAKMTDVIMEIDSIVEECLPATTSKEQGFKEALVLAHGVRQLRDIFKDKNIEQIVMAMKDTPLGFMTDRSPAAVAKKQDLRAYTYNEIKECAIEALLKGYRLTGNEFNIIANRFYAAKNGKHRKITEAEGISNFQITTTSPAYETEIRTQYGKPQTVQFAKVQCYASWKQNGQQCYLGRKGESGTPEDTLIFKIKVNNMMGDDAIVGKALSKLFSRVLLRLFGRLEPEATDFVEGDIIEGEPNPEAEAIEALKSVIKPKREEETESPQKEEKEPEKSARVFIVCPKLKSGGRRSTEVCEKKCPEKCPDYYEATGETPPSMKEPKKEEPGNEENKTKFDMF